MKVEKNKVKCAECKEDIDLKNEGYMRRVRYPHGIKSKAQRSYYHMDCYKLEKR